MTELPFDFKDIVQQSQDAIFITKAFPLQAPGPEIVFVNDAYSRQRGVAADELIGNNSLILQDTESEIKNCEKIRQALQSMQATQIVLNRYNKMGEEYWAELNIVPLKNNQNEVTHFAITERDISERMQLQQMLDESPRKDALTGLFNRQTFNENLSREFSLFSRTHNEYSILLIDIDKFKSIDKVQSRDLVLKELASTFEIIFRAYDLVARIGEDQFCILLRQTTLEQALISAIRFRQMVQKRSFAINGGSINITVSAGVSQVLTTDTDYPQAIHRAEEALQQAKQSGRDQVQLYREEISA